MAESWETLSRDGLIYRITHEIAEVEGKRPEGRWQGVTRDYILDLVRDTVQAIDGIRGSSAPGVAPTGRRGAA